MPRAARVIIPGILHHVVQRGNRREDVFFDNADRNYFLEKLEIYSARASLKLALHCLMKNHTHLLVVPENPQSLEMTFKPLHMSYSQYLNKKFNRHGVNWQGRYFSSPLDEKHTWNAFQYVALNPVRVGASRSIDLYPWSSANALLNGMDNWLLTADPYWLNLGRSALAEIRNGHEYKPDEEAVRQIQQAITRNFPVGSREFIDKLEAQTGFILRPKPIGRPKKTESR